MKRREARTVTLLLATNEMFEYGKLYPIDVYEVQWNTDHPMVARIRGRYRKDRPGGRDAVMRVPKKAIPPKIRGELY